MTTEETLFILVHDAWLGAWSWEKVAEWLAGRGWNVAPLDLPGHGVYQIPEERLKNLTLRHYAATVVGFARANPDIPKLVLVGHGTGGPVIQLAAEQLGERVAGLIFASAYILQNGESILGLMPPEVAEIFKNLAATRSDNRINLKLEPDFWRYNLLNDDLLHAGELLDRLTPEPAAPLGEVAQFKTFFQQHPPCAYISFNEDMSLPPGDFYPRMAAKLGQYHHLNINAGHEGILTKPREVAEAMVLLATQVF